MNMTALSDRLIQVVVPSDTARGSGNLQDRVRLPAQANIIDLLDALKATSSPLYEEVRRHVLKLSGDVLAYGAERPALQTLREQLARGGPIVISEQIQEGSS
jgi:hypothetical protein